MPFTNVISGKAGVQAVLKKKNTKIASKVGRNSWLLHTGDRVQPLPAAQAQQSAQNTSKE